MSTVAVAIVSFNTRDVLRECLASVTAAGATQILVADNGSTDGTIEMLRAEFPHVTVVIDPTNPGYGAAANSAIALCRADYVILLNSDTIVRPGSLVALADYFNRHPRVALIGPRLLNPDGSLQRSCHQFPVGWFAYWAGRILERIPVVRIAYITSFAHDRARAVDWVTGAALAIRRSAFHAVGGFDRRFFLYYEEVDLAFRLRRAGWATHFAPVTEVVHRGGASTAPQATLMRAQKRASGVLFHLLHHTPRRALQAARGMTFAARRGLWFAQLRHFFTRSAANKQPRANEIKDWQQVARLVTTPHEFVTRVVSHQAPCRPVLAPLHLVDWRFLTYACDSRPIRHLKVLAGTTGMAERCRELRLAETISTSCAPESTADLVVAMDDAQESMAAVARSVAPGGRLYLEVDWQRRGWQTRSLAAVCKMLERAGLRVEAAYDVRPGFADRRAIVPLERRHHAWLGIESPYRPVWQRHVTRLKQWWSSSSIVIAAATDSIGHSPGVMASPQLADIMIETQQAACVALLNAGRDRVVVVPIAAGESVPRVVIKISRHPSFNERTRNEHASLERAESLPAALRRGIPVPYRLVNVGGLVGSVQSFLPGVPLATVLRDPRRSLREVTKDLELAMSWLIAMHRATASQAWWDENAHQQWVEQSLRAFEVAFGNRPEQEALFDHARKRSLARIGQPLPRVLQHRDFNVWNLIRDADHLGVLDWEGATPGIPLIDAFQLVASWLHAVRYGHDPQGEDRALLDIFAFSPQADRRTQSAVVALQTYVRELGMDSALLPALLISHRAELALRREQQQRLAGEQPTFDTFEYQTVGTLARFAPRIFESGLTT